MEGSAYPFEMSKYPALQSNTRSAMIETKTSFSQDWTTYNAAQENEIELFDQFLSELVLTVEEPEQKMGRPRLPLSDQLFCAIEKVYSQLSSRRAKSLYNKAGGRAQIFHSPHFNTTSKLLNREYITSILQELIRLTAIPLASIEEDFAVDSTGFRCSTFSRYCEEKHKVKKERNWIKAHICSGVNTNIVTAVSITHAHKHDSTEFEQLVRKTAEDFRINEVTADKAYSSRKSFDIVADVGGVAYIPFKKNATGKAGGHKLWKQAFFFFQYNEEEYLRHYHKRSNVETTIGAIKRKFGETLRSKNTTAQVNELLCKIVAYNITVLIHEMYAHADTQELTGMCVSA